MNLHKMVRSVAVAGLVVCLWGSNGCVRVTQAPPQVVIQNPSSPYGDPSQTPGYFDPKMSPYAQTATGALSNPVQGTFDPAGQQVGLQPGQFPGFPGQIPTLPAQSPAVPSVNQDTQNEQVSSLPTGATPQGYTRTFSWTVQTPSGTRTYTSQYTVSTAGPVTDRTVTPGNLPT